MEIYLVGGAVRDQQLGIPVREKDWLVTGATEQQMLELGYIQLDAGFPVFKHPQTGEEYALARTETKQGTGYKGFTTLSDPSISVEQDLARRDLTINAIAMDDRGKLLDPFNGLQDIRDGKLRHVSAAFVEDPLRLLRIARFAAVLGAYGFHISHETFRLMQEMSVSSELQTIKPQLLLREMNKALHARQPWQFFKVLGKCGALDLLLPGIDVWINGQQMAHEKDAESIKALRRATALSEDIHVRLMALTYRAVLLGDFKLEQYLPLEKGMQQLIHAVKLHAVALLEGNNAQQLLSHLQQLGMFRQGKLFKRVLLVLQAVFPDQQRKIERYNVLQQTLLNVSADNPALQGFTGNLLGRQIMHLRMQLVDEWLSGQS